MKVANVSPLKPYPIGWYVISFSEEVKAGAMKTVKFMGKEVIVWRTKSGKVTVTDAYCPHMGAHFAHGGKVVDETIECPFHAFCFDTKGTCTKTGYNTKPSPRAKLHAYPTEEKNGMIFVYHDVEGKAPEWNIPELDMEGWTEYKHTSWEIASHPQETAENSVDIGHLSIIHGYKEVEMLKPLKTEGPLLNAKYAMSRDAGVFGIGGLIRAEFEIFQRGLGYACVEVEIPKMGMRNKHFVLPTPIDENTIVLRIAACIKKLDKPSKVNPFLGILPKSLATKIVLGATFSGYKHDVAQDFKIWKNKVYIHPPALAKGDGPVGQYRIWAKQFEFDPNQPAQKKKETAEA